MSSGAEQQWVTPKTDLDPEFMYKLWMDGVVGYKEFRNWLAGQYPSFDAVRDSTVDDYIDGISRAQRQSRQAPVEDFVDPQETADPSSGAA
jgi:hypothetical protein